MQCHPRTLTKAWSFAVRVGQERRSRPNTSCATSQHRYACIAVCVSLCVYIAVCVCVWLVSYALIAILAPFTIIAMHTYTLIYTTLHHYTIPYHAHYTLHLTTLYPIPRIVVYFSLATMARSSLLKKEASRSACSQSTLFWRPSETPRPCSTTIHHDSGNLQR
jgi:hypothetical protein